MDKRSKKEVTYKCKYCLKEYKREDTLFTHTCEQKRRWNQRNERDVIIGYNAWIRFMSTIQHRSKTDYTTFMKSKFYLQFVRFGRHIKDLKAIRPDEYIDFLISNSYKLQDWTKEHPYQTYVKTKLAKESPVEAIERSLQTIEEWAIEKDLPIESFFDNVAASRVLYWVIDGKLSPWLIFSSTRFNQVLDRMNSEQIEMLDKYIDKARWKMKIKMHQTDFNNIRNILKEYKL